MDGYVAHSFGFEWRPRDVSRHVPCSARSPVQFDDPDDVAYRATFDPRDEFALADRWHPNDESFLHHGRDSEIAEDAPTLNSDSEVGRAEPNPNRRASDLPRRVPPLARRARARQRRGRLAEKRTDAVGRVGVPRRRDATCTLS